MKKILIINFGLLLCTLIKLVHAQDYAKDRIRDSILGNYLVQDYLAQSKILLDYRQERTYEEPKISPATERFIISQVVTKNDKPCSGNKLEPRVMDLAQGAFTAPRVQQVAYLVNLGDNCHSRGYGTVRLAVASGNQVKTYGDVTGYSSIAEITDLNSDGIKEIILEGGWLGQGYTTTFAKLLEIKPKGILTIKDFEQVYEDNFGASLERNKLYRIVSVISFQIKKNRQLLFSQDYYLAKCTELGGAEYQCSDYQPTPSAEFPQETSSERSICERTINSVVQSVKDKGVIKVVSSIDDKEFAILTNHMGRKTLFILMDDIGNIIYSSRIDAILNSKKLMGNWISKISKDCREIGYVWFGYPQSSNAEIFGIKNNEKIFIYSCAENPNELIQADTKPSLSKGEFYCAYIPLNL